MFSFKDFVFYFIFLFVTINYVTYLKLLIFSGLGDLEFDSKAYKYGAISILVQGLYLTLAQKCLEHMSALQVLYISSYNTTPFYVIVCLLLETEGITLYEHFSGNLKDFLIFKYSINTYNMFLDTIYYY